jgi:hypothetical protein
MASIAIVPASGDVVSVLSACRVEVTGADQNDDTAYDTTVYPQSPEMRYYLTFELASEVEGRSYVFGVNEDGDHTFNNYIFPEAGSWTVRLNDASDDSSVATAAVTVS